MPGVRAAAGAASRGPLRTSALWLLGPVVSLGAVGVAVFGYWALVDWSALQTAYAHYAQVAGSSTDLRAVFVAESQQNLHRINRFADGVWTLLSAILAAIGLHGIVGARRR